MATTLRDLGEDITDRTLTLNLIQGLNERFHDVDRLLHRDIPFPLFKDAVNELLLEEITSAPPSSTPPTALLAVGQAAAPGSPPSAQGHKSPRNGVSLCGGAGSSGSSRPRKDDRRHKSPPRERILRRHRRTDQQQRLLGAQHRRCWRRLLALLPTVAGRGHPDVAWPPLFHGTASNTGPAATGAGASPARTVGPDLRHPPGEVQALAQHQAAQAAQGQQAQLAWTPGYGPTVSPTGWDQQSLASALSTVSLNQPPSHDWYFDSGATSHMTSDPSSVSHSFFTRYPSSIVVGNRSLLPVTSTGTTSLPGPFPLNNVLVSPSLIKNLISVRQFTTDNNCSVEFDPAGCSVKDLESRRVLVRCESAGPLYPLRVPTAIALVAGSSPLWHRRLGHPGHEVLSQLVSVIPSCNKELGSSSCHACQLGRHIRSPFPTFTACASSNFDLIHCDLWTSPVVSASGFKYYLVILDDCSHYLWTFPLRLKSDTPHIG
jgi:hypothetical protein